MALKRFTSGPTETVVRLNELVDALNQVLTITGDPFIRASSSPSGGTTLRLNIDEVMRRIMRYRNLGGDGAALRRAFVSAAPGANTTLVCYLDVDNVGSTIDVICTIYGGGNLNEAHPAFVDGDELWVAYNTIAGEWQNVTRIDGGEECNS